MRKERKGAFRLPQKETWFGLMLFLLGAALMVLSFVLKGPHPQDRRGEARRGRREALPGEAVGGGDSLNANDKNAVEPM